MKHNPLLSPYDNPYGAPDFDLIKTEHYKPAFISAINNARENVSKISSESTAPSFNNTIEALEFADRQLRSVSAIFFNLNHAHTSDLMEKTAMEISPMLTDFSTDLLFDEKLFERIKYVHDKRDSFNLNKEQVRLTEETYRKFTRNGALLSGDKREEFRNISKELANLSLEFAQNVLAATNNYFLHINDEHHLKGIPDNVREAAAEEALSRNIPGWVFTLHMPSYHPFMQYCTERSLREKMWMAYNSRALNGKYSNRKIIKSIASLRYKKARLLGYKNHAWYVLEENMASHPPKVNNFLDNLLEKTLPFAKEELSQISQFAKKNGFKNPIMPWDLNYWSEKFKNEKFKVNDQLLKPYFQLENVQKAVFDLAGKLFGITFEQIDNLPVYHKDVNTFEVKDQDGELLAILYTDYFPRESKRGGAWMTSFRELSVYKGKKEHPLVSVVMNFTKATKQNPSLLTFQEVTTLLHEFGHALHGILANGSYPSLTGTNVVRDFVELPSQIMENWATEKEFLLTFAKHFKTEETIPDSLIDKIIQYRNYMAGYNNVRQITFGLIDMFWHDIKDPEKSPNLNQPQANQPETNQPQVNQSASNKPESQQSESSQLQTSLLDNKQSEFDVEQYEIEATKKAQLLPRPELSAVSTSFSHIFSGGYSAGYYSYKWAEVLEADAFSLFKEKGIFDRSTAQSFRKHILAAGNSEEASTLYRKFRGRDPEEEALLEKYGMR
jgi:peptidyl-dipeptidase Dcp